MIFIACSRLIPLHRNKGRSLFQTLFDRVSYAENEVKTEGGNLVMTFGCETRSAEEEFMLTKRDYEHFTGRSSRQNDVIAYQIRQAFKPGEIDPETALKLGYDLAMRFTKGKHQFIAAVHTDRKHIHSHVIFNSTTIDAQRKFKNFWGSAFALRRLSDLICYENGLSVIENPKPSRGSYGDWLGDKKPPSHKRILQQTIDEILPSASTYDDFISRLIAAGFEVNVKGKHHTAKLPDWGKPTRIDNLGGDYTISAITARLGIGKVKAASGDSGTHTKVSLLVDIQAKIREGKGEGYRQWATVFNLKQAAKTLLFLEENGIADFEDLKKKSSSASGEFALLNQKIRDAEKRMKDITELQKYIGQYGKTRETYANYKASGWDSGYYDDHAADVILHRAAKKYFDGLGLKKLPSITQLKQEWAALAAEKKSLYAGYRELKNIARELSVAYGNAQRILGIAPGDEVRETQPGKSKGKSKEIG